MAEVFVRLRRGRWPLSKGLLVEALLPLGVPLEAAQAVAHTVEERLKAEGQLAVPPRVLRRVFLEEVARALGEEVADRLSRQTLPFEEILVLQGRKRRPFSKGLLARSLEEAGFSLKEAHDLAKEVEGHLRQEGVRQISARRLEEMVAQVVGRALGKGARRRYLQRQAFAGELFVEEESGEPRMPFSKGILAQSLMGIGFSPERAYRLAREMEKALRQEGRRVIRRNELRERVYQALLKEAGEEVARRYLLLRSLRRSARPVHILIGGVTGVGKSVLASALAYRLGITHIVPSDAVREVFRASLSQDLLPTLHLSTFEAWRALLLDLSGEESHEVRVMRGFLDQVARVAVGLRAIQERSALEGTSIVLEGVHVVPRYLDHPYRERVLTVPMLVVLQDEKLHRDRFLLRDRETAHARPQEKYLTHFAEIRLIQEHLLRWAQEEGIPVIPGEDLDEAVEKALEVLVAYLEAHGSREVARA
ncbi:MULTISPECIES: ATP cone domain-containing protein [Thermus]|uniref:2-phosphoglycerate kinase n=1 Tax=Thermus scotoductus TaxID=37636 RepID=A0A430R1G1_THESC|nr:MULTISPECIES: ATP cone domain-containing protein [Thermus]RTG92467.1 2-phosphoglycerate kinase [Thermus scotoductus]RTH01246.1 2-phosphoglycerate kinase [Thermus scotoductus]RTH16418.1 2-phosphoglycerate kinase [Thermus scotoductus]RTH96478.1 2-phosphoglycerate kinase [Thermus scotoductus]RTI11045.1 2-phosphoglycerate kinase [Thermus scotoductus]